MSHKIWQSEISKDLENSLNKFLPDHDFKEVIKYSVFPTGKLFRPLLVYSLAQDLGEITHGHKELAKSVELHHTYTLIHDDLPSMDNDEERRGRPSSHIKFTEWEAILAGDALLNLSYELLSNIPATHLPNILRLYGSYMGSKGLILGQVMDLGNDNKSLDRILKLHELKTGRLIQLCLEATSILSNRVDIQKDLKKLGQNLGVNFQLLDDLCELTEPINKHELEINPFIHYNKSELLSIIIENNKFIHDTCSTYKLNNLASYIAVYYNKIHSKLENGHESINKNIKFNTKELKDLWSFKK